MRNISIAVFLAFLLVSGNLFSAPASVTVDFVQQKITVWGIAGCPWEAEISPEEERSRAWMDALHHGYEEILEVPIMEGISVGSAIHSNPALKERLGQVLLAAPKTFYQTDESGLMRCRLEIPFCGPMSLRSAFYLAALRPGYIDPAGFGASGTFMASETQHSLDVASHPGYLRIVIDLRKSPFEPSLFPRFFSEDGFFLFQEAKVPGPKRFSRPLVRFSKDIRAAEEGLKPEEVMYAAGYSSPLFRRDVKIAAPDADIFFRFCRQLAENPEKRGEILIIYGDILFPGGLLPKAQAKEPTKAAAHPKVGPQKKQKKTGKTQRQQGGSRE